MTYTVEEVRAEATVFSNDRYPHIKKMLTAYADLLAQIERAEPYCYTWAKEPDADGVFQKIPLYTHPSADRLAEALRFYANPEVYKPNPHGPAFDRRDLSHVAREALAAEKRAAQAGVTDELCEKFVQTALYFGAAEDFSETFGKTWELQMTQIRAALEAVWPGDVQDAKRYRWLRQHFRFANDSLHELWFDASLEPDDAGVPADLDQELDAAMQGANAGKQR